MSKLENDCLTILQYACEKWPRWVSIVEITERRNIPSSTIRTIFAVSKSGIFVKTDGDKTSIHPDVFDKIAKKFRFNYKIKKLKTKNNKICWHISAVKMDYIND